ncbi:transcription termination/antitermination protein NusG [Hyphomicrobium sp.]|jgi:transcriptional antiterminator RfaH|uniref:transcription termination/antitermination protein NusG n=1 Tax=Hyphomicrobium sp. TaxID=82 RepID=UPI0035675E24
MNTSGVEDNARAIWIAANTHPNREQVAEHHLRNQGYEPYMPVMRKQIRHARQVRDVLRPLFPGYLFVHLSPAHRRWRPILSTVGIRSVVCSGDVPCVVPETFIDDLKQREQDGVIVRSASSRQIGETVRIVQGAFDGLAGKIIGLSENDRLIVLLDFLNRPVRVKIPGDLLSVA